jgi:hypothetical protein
MTDHLSLLGNKMLQSAVRENLVSFPAQVPVFPNPGGDTQARMAQLYFASGWTIARLRERYRTTGETVRKNLTEWRVRAVSSGYIEDIGSQVSLPREIEESSATALQLVHPRIVSLAVSEAPDPDDVPFLLLEEIQSGTSASLPWPSFCFRLLSILRQECIDSGMSYSAAQAARIEAVALTDPRSACDLLRDLGCRLRDERESAPRTQATGSVRITLLHTLVQEIEVCVQEANGWQPHCDRLLETVRKGCLDLAMRFSLRQLDRLRRALEEGPAQVRDAVRELRNRMTDEQDDIALTRGPDRELQMAVGNVR